MESYNNQEYVCPSCGAEDGFEVWVTERVIVERTGWGELTGVWDGRPDIVEFFDCHPDEQEVDSEGPEYDDIRCLNCGWEGCELKLLEEEDEEQEEDEELTPQGNPVALEVAPITRLVNFVQTQKEVTP